MPAAKTKSELLDVTGKEWTKLQRVLETFDEASGTRPGRDGFTAQRLIGHRAAWIDLYFDWCEAAAKDQEPEMPAPGFKWNQLPDLNDQIWAAQRNWTWPSSVAALTAAHERLLRDIEAATDDELYGQPLAPGLKWTRGRYAEASGPSHYRSATKALKKM